MKLRPYQERWVEAVVEDYRSGINRQLGKAATGTGKTPFFASLKRALGFKRRMLVLAHRDELIQQAASKVKKWNPDDSVGIEMAQDRAGDADWVIASVQTLGRSGSERIKQFNPDQFDGVIIDEAHHSTADTYLRVVDHFHLRDDSNKLLMGVTATPNRADGEGLGEVYQKIVFDYSILDGIRDGYLADLRGIRVPTSTVLDGVHTRAGDFDLGELRSVVDTDERNELVIQAWCRYGDDRPTIGFGVNIEHCKRLANTAKQYGISAEAIWGDDEARHSKLTMHQKGYIKILFNAQLLTEGYDDWRVGCILWSRPTKSETFYTQGVGRGTRIPEGIDNLKSADEQGIHVAKRDCILIDVVDVARKHSLVTLASLHGLKSDVDFKGKSLAQVVDELDRVKQKRPFVDLSNVNAEDIDELVRQAEAIDLFRVEYAPEIIQISDYQWHKISMYAYLLKLDGDDAVLVTRSILDRWDIIGNVNGNRLNDYRKTFEEAIREADLKVRIFGGRNARTLVRREAKWHGDPPTPGQLRIIKRFGIKVPANATKGQVQQKLNEIFMRINRHRYEKMAKGETS